MNDITPATDDIDAIALLDEPVRRTLYEWVVRQGRPGRAGRGSGGHWGVACAGRVPPRPSRDGGSADDRVPATEREDWPRRRTPVEAVHASRSRNQRVAARAAIRHRRRVDGRCPGGRERSATGHVAWRSGTSHGRRGRLRGAGPPPALGRRGLVAARRWSKRSRTGATSRSRSTGRCDSAIARSTRWWTTTATSSAG